MPSGLIMVASWAFSGPGPQVFFLHYPTLLSPLILSELLFYPPLSADVPRTEGRICHAWAILKENIQDILMQATAFYHPPGFIIIAAVGTITADDSQSRVYLKCPFRSECTWWNSLDSIKFQNKKRPELSHQELRSSSSQWHFGRLGRLKMSSRKNRTCQPDNLKILFVKDDSGKCSH